MADLGDISEFLKEGNVADLSWLDVNEKDYQAIETLPKQNLNIAPDLEALWARDDTTPQAHVPNRADMPKTMGDLSEIHGFLTTKPEEIRKVARLAVMQSNDPAKIMDALVKRFDKDSLRAARSVLAEVLAERGLLGPFYIDAADFPDCHKGSRRDAAFVHRFASGSRYVLAKNACQGCSCATQTPTGCNCATFHKEIKLQVPYTEALAAEVEQAQRAKGKQVQASTSEPRERIRLAMLAPSATPNGPRVYASYGQPAVPAPVSTEVVQSQLTQDVAAKAASDHVAALTATARPVMAFLRRELLKGRTEAEAQYALKLAFKPEVLQQTAVYWQPLMAQAGVYGVVYSSQDSFADCHEGADFIAKHNTGVRAIVQGDKCASCIYSKANRCLMYGKALVAKHEDILNSETVAKVLAEHKAAGRIASWDNTDWGSNPIQALRNIHTAASQSSVAQAPARMGVLKAFYGQAAQHSTEEITKRNIVLATAQYMNEGLYGVDLLTILRSRFDPRDIQAAAQEIKPLLSEQGLQGIFYVDPAVYDDYGKGCEKAASLHRSRLVPYVKIGSKCGSCVLQSKPGFCSKLNKSLVVEPPYEDKLAQQRQVLASGRATETSYENLVNNGHTMMAEYEVQQNSMDFELDPVVTVDPLNISFK